MGKSKVFFTSKIEGESLVRLYEALGVKLEGNVAVKLHSGEEGNQNYMKHEFVRDVIEHVGGTVVECNTRKILLALKCRIMILCWYYLILKGILWVDLVEPLRIYRLGLLQVVEKIIFIVVDMKMGI